MELTRDVEILLVEDSEADVRMAEKAIGRSKVINNLHIARDGQEGLDYLYKQPPFQEAITPDIILLDLNLPKKNGREVLEIIKNDEKLMRIPVVVLTTSKSEEDIIKSYNLHANSYITKPVDFQSLTEIVKTLENFWFKIVTLPGE